MRISLFKIFWEIGSLANIGVGVRIWRIYRRTKEKAMDYFAKFFLFGGVGFSIAALIGSIITNPFFMKLEIVISVFILFISAAYLIRLCCFLLYPKLEKTAFWGVIFCNLLLLVFQLKDFLLPRSFSFFYNPKLEVIIVNYPPKVALLIVAISFIALFIPGTIFIVKGYKSEDRKIRIRATLLGLGMVFFGIGGGANTMGANTMGANTIPNPPFILISAISMTLAFLSILAGAFYTIKK